MSTAPLAADPTLAALRARLAGDPAGRADEIEAQR